MSLDDMKLIYTYLNGYLSEDEIVRFEQKMQDPEFCSMFVQFIEDEELIQRAMSEIRVPRHSAKTVKKFVRKAITFAAAAACIVFGYFYYEKNNFMANLSSHNGEVLLNRGSGEVELIDQVKIKRGDTIETENGNCSIKFRDGTVVDIKPFSILKIEEKSGKLLILNKGKLYSDVTPSIKVSSLKYIFQLKLMDLLTSARKSLDYFYPFVIHRNWKEKPADSENMYRIKSFLSLKEHRLTTERTLPRTLTRL